MWSINGVGPWLDILPKGNRVNARNNVIRWSLVEMGYAWAGAFLGRRFTNYVRPFPFFYRLSFKNTVRKFRRMGLLEPILMQQLYGWDPWGSEGPPRELIDEYRRAHPEARGAFSRSGNFFTLSKTIRAQAKESVRKYVAGIQYSKLRPLVESGGAEKTALTGHRVASTATAKKMTVKVLIPLGGPKNPVVGNIIRVMPAKEVAFCAEALGRILAKRLQRTGVPAPGPLPITRGVNTGERKAV